EIGAAGKQKFADAQKNPVTARSVRVRVLNGTTTSGLAGVAAEQLRKLGFTVIATGNAQATDKSVISYSASLKDQAEVLAGRLPGTTTKESAQAVPGAVTLMIGQDFSAIAEKVAI
ncbi:LytR C-terminal domain-containing protein, partial [Streptomyces noursei]|uniref:LytR C-terminal domain-containing protein n=1 Tax=Streptomyces noursei TaxID=1971 RepID=UPI0034078EED